MNGLRDGIKLSLVFCGVAVALIAALPILFVLAVISRFVLVAGAIVAVVFGVAAYILSRRFRTWVDEMAEGQANYSGLRLATDVALHPAHAWARVEPTSSAVGCDDLAQAALGPVQRVELPVLGQSFRRGDPLFRLWNGPRKLDVRAPVSGTVVATNRALVERPTLLNDDPYRSGWAVRMRCDRPWSQRRSLMRGSGARAWFRREVDRLLAEVLGDAREPVPTLPDGGTLFRLDQHLDEPAWARLTREFFTRDSEDGGN